MIGVALGATNDVLSVGPLIQLNKRGLISPETIEKVYFPLSFLADIPGFNGMLNPAYGCGFRRLAEQGQPE